MFKIKIQNCFDRASSSYENEACIQKESAQFLVQKLLQHYPGHYNTILDLGAGTGYLSEILLKHFPSSYYTLNDISSQMLYIARLKFNNQNNFQFIQGDMETTILKNYHLIVSSFALQWAENLWRTLKNFYQLADVFAFSCLLQGTFREWHNILSEFEVPSVLSQYPTERDLIAYCLKLNPHLLSWSKNFTLTFANSHSLMKYLHNLGANSNIADVPYHKLKELLLKYSHDISVTYKVFFGIFKK